MPDLTIILAVASLVLLGVSTWNALCWATLAAPAAESEPRSVAVLVPARNEEANLPACIEAALAQGDVVREVLVYDDHSSDGTARVVQDYAQRDPRTRLIEPSILEPGWCGKPFACAQLAKAATAPILLFVDADTRLHAGAAARIVGELHRRRVGLIAPWPNLEAHSLWEQILMPMLNVVVFSTYPAPLGVSRQDPALGLAHGACLAFSREGYQNAGGHEAVRNEIFEDTLLARHLRSRGTATACLDGRGAVSVRMYNSFAGIWRGFQKNFYPAFASGITFWAFMLLHAAVYLLPFVLLVVHPTLWVYVSVGALLSMRTVLALRFGQPLWPVLLHPLAECVLLGIGFSSWFRVRAGRGVTWKGRTYLGGAQAIGGRRPGEPVLQSPLPEVSSLARRAE